MTDEPVTWFHGLIAERVAEFCPDATQVPFFQREIMRYGQPALDLGCGVGRLLLPLLRAGLDIDGCDISGDMLRHCREKAAALGLKPQLYQQPMHALDLPRNYRTIFICASFNLAGSRDNGLATLQRCYAHTQNGGALLFDIDAEYAWPGGWEEREPSRFKNLPEPWPEKWTHRITADGSEYVEQQRMLSLDPVEQRMVRQVRIEKWVSGKLVESQEYTQHRTLYLPEEVRSMLQVAGFREITIRGDYSDEPATPESKELIFTALKQSYYKQHGMEFCCSRINTPCDLNR
jgi:SAM-dependent methyltransferase